MKVIAKTDEYTIFQKRSERYAVRGQDRAWINGDAKVSILLEHKLIEAPAPSIVIEQSPQAQASAQIVSPTDLHLAAWSSAPSESSPHARPTTAPSTREDSTRKAVDRAMARDRIRGTRRQSVAAVTRRNRQVRFPMGPVQ